MKQIFILLVLASISVNYLKSQDFNKCLVDLSAINPSLTINYKDYDKEYQLIPELIPNYKKTSENNGFELIWYQYERDLSTKEIKKYKKRLNDFRRLVLESFGSTFNDNATNHPWIWNDSTIVRACKLYVRKKKTIDSKLPVFFKHDGITKETSKCSPDIQEIMSLENDVYSRYDYAKGNRSNVKESFNKIGNIPVLDLLEYKDFKWLYKRKSYSITEGGFFEVSSDSISYSFFIKRNFNKAANFLWKKEQVKKINILCKVLSSNEITLIYSNDSIVKNPEVLDVVYYFDKMKLTINFNRNSKKESLDVFIINTTEKNVKYNIVKHPIYYTNCFDSTLIFFNKLTLDDDYFEDNNLKKALYNTVVFSSDWLNYKIESVILTNKSQWNIVTNKYTDLVKSRFIFADVYAKNTRTGKCFLIKDVYFSQKLDPIGIYTYSIFVASPQNFYPYPCNLK